MERFPRGSEWRKWDLHVHMPGTKLSDGYGESPDWDTVCRVVEESDVAVSGITDYFSFDSYYSFIDQFSARYPESSKVFFPNLELRLNDVVNKDSQHVNFHLIFRPETARFKLDGFLRDLKTEIFDERGRAKSCAELEAQSDFEKATVTRQNLFDALRAAFGEREHWIRDFITAVPSNNDGIRAESGVARKANVADQIDKASNIIFGSVRNVDYYLASDRFEDSMASPPKPVFTGCDAHSLEQLTSRLGRVVSESGFELTPTWVKADPTFEGLLQTLIEPAHRVKIQATRPDPRESYQHISKVRFSGSSDFPLEIDLNPNLVSIIGARSSGKSSLLAYVAHAVDPEHVVEQQVAASGVSAAQTGPAAGKTWQSVEHIECSVEWGDTAAQGGRVIYIPQNSLYAISERPSEITAKIEPAVHRLSPEFASLHRQTVRDVESQNQLLEQAARSWFAAKAACRQVEEALRNLGDRAGVQSEYDKLNAQIALLREQSSLTPVELESYARYLESEGGWRAKVRALEGSVALLDTYFSGNFDEQALSTEVSIDVEIRPSLADFPLDLKVQIDQLVDGVVAPLKDRIASTITAYRADAEAALAELRRETDSERERHAEVIAKNSANVELDDLVKRRQKQDEVLARMTAFEADIAAHATDLEDWGAALVEAIAKRSRLLSDLEARFRSVVPSSSGGMTFGLEAEFSTELIDVVSRSFNLRVRSEYVDRDRSGLKLEDAQRQPVAFMMAVLDGSQKLRQGEDVQVAVIRALTATPQIRFFASLDGDRIGGFMPSSMTPGKQALFALTLILDESSEPWPLLIDQPEDDLDSRSVYDQIVPYLVRRKRERQILMVTHNANLVIGADSEQVVVANRHGDDRKNPGGQQFSYFSGALEHSKEKDSSSRYILDSCGVREHACEILDGGSEAFRKRMEKYKIVT